MCGKVKYETGRPALSLYEDVGAKTIMRYFGGKVRVGKHIARVLNTIEAKTYHEPFCGMYGVGRYITIPKRSGADTHPDLIQLLHALQNGWRPPTVLTSTDYERLRSSNPSALRAFAGFGCSFGGKFFGGYAKDQSNRNYAMNASRALMKLVPLIKGVRFVHQDYLEYDGSADVIYCDPPYKGTTGFSHGHFDPDAFWEWVRKFSHKSRVFVSEYVAPDDFIAVWEKQVHTDMNSKQGEKIPRIEKLFTLQT